MRTFDLFLLPLYLVVVALAQSLKGYLILLRLIFKFLLKVSDLCLKRLILVFKAASIFVGDEKNPNERDAKAARDNE